MSAPRDISDEEKMRLLQQIAPIARAQFWHRLGPEGRAAYTAQLDRCIAEYRAEAEAAHERAIDEARPEWPIDWRTYPR